MRDKKRMNKVLDALWQLWLEVPDWRFCQLTENFARYIGGDPFYIEDEDFIELLQIFKSDITHGNMENE